MTPPPPTPRRSPLPTLLLLLLLLLLALPLTACSSSDDDSSPTTTKSPEQEVEAAYGDYREMVRRLLESPDPDDPEIARRADGSNQDFLVAQLTNLVSNGRALRFGPAYGFELLSVTVSDGEATVRDCTVDDAETIDVASGGVVSEGTTTELLEATLRLVAGDWRVNKVERIGHWDGAVRCDE